MRLWSFFLVLLIPNPWVFAATVNGIVGLSDNPFERNGSTVRCIQCDNNPTNLEATTLADGSYSMPNVPAGTCSFSASHIGYNQDNRDNVTIVENTDNKLDFILSKGNVQITPTYSIDGTITLDSSGGNTPASLSNSRVNIWITNGSQHFSAVTDVNGHFVIDNVPEGSYQAGAAREGYLTQVLDPFELNANRTLNFQLAVDPNWDYGPGDRANLPGCSVSSSNNPLWVLILGFFIWWAKKYAHV